MNLKDTVCVITGAGSGIGRATAELFASSGAVVALIGRNIEKLELVRADITEVDIHTNPTSNCQTPTEQRFTQLTEKIVINLTLKVLQNQQVRVTALA